ncbi:carboxypeptidase regulatory-like domain-containing protein [Candidatus Sumerlaeota bacterium]|nr:carboxypeptidase regulatory-like domain-containing protein [Candidatus Sumerlaeota bacterium]
MRRFETIVGILILLLLASNTLATNLIEVWVKDSFGDPVSGTTVTIGGVGYNNKCVTRSKGVCSFYVPTSSDPQHPMTYTISATNEFFPISPPTQTVEIPGGSVSVVVNVSFKAVCGMVKGTVKFDTGDPLTTASVEAFDKNTGNLVNSNYTKNNGEYSLKLYPGSFDISISYVVDKIRGKTGNYVFPPREVQINEDQIVSVDFVVPDTTISGKVVDIDNNPIPNTSIALYPLNDPSIFIIPEITTQEGTFSFDFIPYSSYKVYIIELIADETYQPKIVELTPENPHIFITHTIQHIGEINGKIYAQDLNHITITALKKDSKDCYGAIPNAGGSYSIKGMKLGEYKIKVSKTDIMYDCFPEKEVTLTRDSPTATVDFHAYPGTLHIRCPFPDTQLEILSKIDNEYKIHSFHKIDTPTTITLNYLPFGTYRLYARNQEYTIEEKEVELTDANTPLSVELTTGNSSLRVKVKEPDNSPIPAAEIHLQEPKTGLEKHVFSDGNGEFVFSGLTAGPYILISTKPGYSHAELGIFLQDNEHRDVEIILSPTPLDFSGYVYDKKTSSPLKNVSIRLINQTTRSVFSTTSTQTGNFSFTGISPRLYSIRAEKEGYANFSLINIPVATTGTLHINIPLTTQKGEIAGHVFKEDGTTPFQWVYITANSVKANSSGSALSDENGAYQIENLAPADDYILTAVAPPPPSYEKQTISPLSVEDDKITSVNITMHLSE